MGWPQVESTQASAPRNRSLVEEAGGPDQELSGARGFRGLEVTLEFIAGLRQGKELLDYLVKSLYYIADRGTAMTDAFIYSDPPILLDNVIEDLGAVVGLLERNAPYTPLGGWFRPDHDGGEATSPMWFQKTWVHADFAVEGADLFVWNERVIEAAREFCDAEVVVPHTVYVNLMAAIAECGPAHTDNPKSFGAATAPIRR